MVPPDIRTAEAGVPYCILTLLIDIDKMKYSGALVTFFTAAAAVAVDQKVSYDGYKVIRIPLANIDDGHAALKLIDDMGLEPWKAPYAGGDFTDLILSPSQLAEFNVRASSFSETKVLHEDLGLSIAQENNVTDTYVRKCISISSTSPYIQLTVLKPGH